MAYEYLHDHIYDKGGQNLLFNTFFSLTNSHIETAEAMLKMKFPSELRAFYEEIGYGNLTAPINPPDDYVFYGANMILHPLVVARFRKGQLLNADMHAYMSEDTYEMLAPDDLPFFEIGDSSSFLIMKPKSDKPNAIYTVYTNIKIEDHFERFIWRLYHESPGYYGDVIESFYANKKK